MGLRLKLGFYVVAFTASILGLISWLSIQSETNLYLVETENRDVRLLQALAIPCAVAMANHDIATLHTYVDHFARSADHLDLRYLAILDQAGVVVAHTLPSEFGKIYMDEFSLNGKIAEIPISRRSTRERLLEMAVPVTSGVRWGTLLAGFNLESTHQAIARNRSRLLWASLAVLVGAAAVAYAALSFLVVNPIIRMREMARRFGNGERNARVKLVQQDEVGELATQLNGMAEQIENYTSSLELAVAERTQELGEANEQLRLANEKLEMQVRTDSLTGLFNRRYFMERLHIEIKRGTRRSHQFALMMMDVDHFKHYNDTNGHPAGDELLHELAELLKANLRSTDFIARYGGEEFIILLLDTSPDEGLSAARKLQQVIAAHSFPFQEKQPLGTITVSAGVAFYPHDAKEAKVLIDCADQSLYVSKKTGRNRVSRWADVIRPE